MDPAEFRILNGAKENDRRPDGLQYARIGQIETVEAIRDSEHYQSPLEGKYRGRGIASGYWNNWGGQSSATAVLNPDGTVNLNEASTDIGGTRASIAMQLAEAMDIEYEQVKARVVDTDTVSYNDVTGGSRTTFATGLAAYNLGRQLLKEMKSRLADQWEVAAGDVSYEEGTFSAGSESVSFAEAAGLVQREEPLMASSTVHPQDFGPGFSTQCVDIEVDPDTGKITILRYTICPGRWQRQSIPPMSKDRCREVSHRASAGQSMKSTSTTTRATFSTPVCSTTVCQRPLDLPMIETIMVEVPPPRSPLWCTRRG